MTNSGSTLAVLGDLRWLQRLATALTHNTDDADDLVQDTLVAAWSDPPPDREQPLRPWLAIVLRNRFRMRLRAQGRRERREQAGESRSATTSEPDRELVRLELLRVLLAELECLAPEDRKLVVRRFFEGESAVEIARALAIPAATVRSRLHRSLQRLRERLDARFGARSTWCAAILVSPSTPAIPPADLIKGISMSIPAKIVILTSASALGMAGWLALPAAALVPPATSTPSPQPHPAAPAWTSTPATPEAAWERRRTDIRRTLPREPAPPRPPSRADVLTDAPIRELMRACLQDLDSEASGAVTIALSQIGAPDIGTIYDAVELVETTFADREVLQCLTQSIYGWVGEAPSEAFERRSTITMVLGEPEEAALKSQRTFEAIVGAHIREVQYCGTNAEPHAPPARGSLTLEWTMAAASVPAKAVRMLATNLPQAVTDCIIRASERWIFPETMAGQTHEYHFSLPIGADAATP